MNTITGIILIALAVDVGVHFVADSLNLKGLRTQLPKPFEGVYDTRRYARSQAYLRVNTIFGQVSSGFHLLVLLAFWFASGFARLDQWVGRWQMGPVLSGLLFIGVLLLLKAVLSLPFRIYATFVIEQRFGFNKTTIPVFAADRIKSLVLAMLLGGPLLAGILAFFQYAGSHAWWLCWMAVTLFMLAVQFVAPNWILPLFNKFTPLGPGKCRDAILAYTRAIGFRVDNIYVMDGSKRSGKSNAFFTGFGRHKRIVLYDTLLDRHATREILAILAHEMGHYRKNHLFKNLLLGIFQTGIMFFLLSVFISWQPLFDAFLMKQPSVYAGIIFFGLLYAPLDFLTGLLLQAFSRRYEYEADRFAVETTGDAEALADALKKLNAHNLSNLTPHPFYVLLNCSHPPVLARLAAMDRLRERSAAAGSGVRN